MMFSRALRVTAVCALVAVAAACAPSTSSKDSGDVKLTVWSWRTEDVSKYNKMFAKFHEKNPTISVEFKAYKNTEYNTILQTGLTEAGGPDVPMLRSYGVLQPVIEAGSLVPLDGKVDTAGFSEQVLTSAKGKKDGKLYGVPAAVQTLQVFYNKKIFADNGIAVPTTYAGMISDLTKLKAKGVTPIATTGKDTWMLPIVQDIYGSARYGGGEFQKKVLTGNANFTDPGYVASINQIKELQPYMPKDVAAVSYTDAQTLFFTGKAATFPGGSFELGFFTKQNPDLQVGTFQVPPPTGSALTTAVTPGYADASFGINAKSKHQKEALKLVKWMATKDFGQMYTDELKQISPVPGVEASDAVLKEMQQAYAKNPAPYLMVVDFRYGNPTGTDLIGAGIQKMLLGRDSATGVAQSTQKGLSQWFKPSGG